MAVFVKPREKLCPQCGSTLLQASTGRPRVYCGEVCRRSAEYELRRVQALLTRAERAVQTTAFELSDAEQWELKRLQRRLDFWCAEVAELNGRLRRVLAGQASAAEPGGVYEPVSGGA